MRFACAWGRLGRQTRPCFSRCRVLRLPLCPQTPGGAGGLFLSHDEWTFWPVLFGHGPSHSLLSKSTSVASGPVLTTAATGYSHHDSQATESLEIPSIDSFLRASMVQGLGPRAHQCKPQAPHRPAVNHLGFRGVSGDPWHPRRKMVAHGGLGWGRGPRHPAGLLSSWRGKERAVGLGPECTQVTGQGSMAPCDPAARGLDPCPARETPPWPAQWCGRITGPNAECHDPHPREAPCRVLSEVMGPPGAPPRSPHTSQTPDHTPWWPL